MKSLMYMCVCRCVDDTATLLYYFNPLGQLLKKMSPVYSECSHSRIVVYATGTNHYALRYPHLRGYPFLRILILTLCL